MKAIACLVIALFFALVIAAALALAAGAPLSPSALPDVLVIERAYTGPIERTGRLNAWQFTGPAMLVDFSPDGDPLFRNGFDGAEFSSCRP